MFVWTLTSVIEGEEPKSEVFGSELKARMAQATHFAITKSAEPSEIARVNTALLNTNFRKVQKIISETLESASCNEYLIVSKHTFDGPLSGPISVFTDRELATLLHGLRTIQESLEQTVDGCAAKGDGCDHFDEVEQLTSSQIDGLCDRLNLTPDN